MTRAQHVAASHRSVSHAANLLREGGVVVVPTDTFYALAANVYRPKAVARVFAIKGRPQQKSVPVLVGSKDEAMTLVDRVPPTAEMLMDLFWPGALTLVLPAAKDTPAEVRGSGNTMAVRVPAAGTCLGLLRELGRPIVGTSANRADAPPAQTAEEAIRAIGDEVDLVLIDDQASRYSAPSTVVEPRESDLVVHRQGALSMSQIREALGSDIELVSA